MENKQMSIEELYFSKKTWEEILALHVASLKDKTQEEIVADPQVKESLHMVNLLKAALLRRIDNAMKSDSDFVFNDPKENTTKE